MINHSACEPDVRQDLCRLARFGANITDAHSCFIFVPPAFLSAAPAREEDSQYLDLGGYHSLSRDVVEPCRLLRGVGIIGWVAKHRQPIHVSPFEHDSRTLGMYKVDQKLKSFIGIPIPLKPPGDASPESTGVVGCDSKKSYAFSKLQGKLLQDLAFEIAQLLRLIGLHPPGAERELSWQQFLERGRAAAEALGAGAVEVLRASLTNFSRLEAAIGTGACIALADQLFRLIQQALPPHLPICRLPNGDIVMVVDNMMSSYYEHKIAALANRIGSAAERPHLKFLRRSSPQKQGRVDLEALISATAAQGPVFKLTGTAGPEPRYEYR